MAAKFHKTPYIANKNREFVVQTTTVGLQIDNRGQIMGIIIAIKTCYAITVGYCRII
jgi:hypothetical protein